MNQQNLV